MTKLPRRVLAILPHYARLAWTLRDDPSDDAPASGLSPAKIVDAAVMLADRGGLAGLTIRRLAQDLGFSAMAVYRHIESRDELLILIVDAALGEPTDAVTTAPSWQEGLRRWGEEL